MESIIVEVNEVYAKIWQNASSEKKEQLAKSIEILINKSDTESTNEFWQFVETINQKAAANGLTEQELNRILSEK
ncbi:MAG: hypothetical protein EOP43_05200 [Sphingobacteriaceae bacterium]|nr:MAG: hypothetical protein EOP43_05200 [Sphingobacteriaceae bacterium]